MEKIKHTKNELKKQKDDLKRFTRYLPTLILKKQQLQLEIIKILHAIDRLEEEEKNFLEKLSAWVSVFAEAAHLERLVALENIETSTSNIAGRDIPLFKNVTFKEEKYSFLTTPIWIDYGIESIKSRITLKARRRVLDIQLRLIKEELRVTTQRVNLFEKVKIPQAIENIRKVRIFLGDMQTAAVVTGKIAKKKIEKKEGVLV
ncbi:MAG: V-type ATP synthase subunit D [Omnitrophica bacterium]|nr:V-type ATP synthase subunit D [Candidatus Omnitrophota bacterium]